MTKETGTTIILCIVRSTAFLAFLATVILGARYLELDYADAKAILVLVNAYFPEMVALVIFSVAGLVFYRASINADNDFEFVDFFRADKHADIWRLGYFLLLLAAVWSIFAMYWREKLTPEYIGVILAAFIVKNIADTAGKIWGPPKDPKA